MIQLRRYVFASVCVLVLFGGTVEAATATITWDRSPEPTVTGYRVSIGSASRVYSQTIDVGAATTWTGNVNAYQTYYFAVQAYDGLGRTSPHSAEVVRAAQAALVPDFGPVGSVAPGGADLVWQHSDGSLSVWYMDGATLIEAGSLNPSRVSDPNWRIVGAGDFDRDRKVDLVWQHKTLGRVVIWLMNGPNYRGSATLATIPDLNWEIVSVGDMNRDGNPDLVWQHRAAGNLAVWFMNGTTVQGGAEITPNSMAVDTWKIVGAADFDLDGSADLLWQHKDGRLSVWFMNGVTRRDGRSLSPSSVSPTWKVVAVADYNQDGRPDLIFQRDDGFLSAWFLNGIVSTSSTLLNPPQVSGGKWRIVGPK